MGSRGLVLGMALAVSWPLPGGGAGEARAAESCVPLQRVAAMADSGFQRLRGYFEPRLQGWMATYRMAGAAHCLVREADGVATYACTWRHDPAAGTAADAYRALMQQVTRCLELRGSSRQDLGRDGEVTRYGLAGSGATVAVGLTPSASAGDLVTLEVVPRDLESFPAD